MLFEINTGPFKPTNGPPRAAHGLLRPMECSLGHGRIQPVGLEGNWADLTNPPPLESTFILGFRPLYFENTTKIKIRKFEEFIKKKRNFDPTFRLIGHSL